ncbi:unnamed protein product [Mesocestoides corti]|uniref:Kinesin motor domain-containing protein n=1 Tax=Mesocestoides corti TaxID=53468 RepID=A0A0R3UIS4_MESCO|nr:unnamed protein product [Mesocestoides corti]
MEEVRARNAYPDATDAPSPPGTAIDNLKMPVAQFFDAISIIRSDKQNVLESTPLKRPPTDFVAPQDWSIYVKICCHLKQTEKRNECSDVGANRQNMKDDIQGRNCLIRLVSAFNRLYAEYSLLCDAVEKAREEPGHFLNHRDEEQRIRRSESHSDERKGRGDGNGTRDYRAPGVIPQQPENPICRGYDSANTCFTKLQLSQSASCNCVHCRPILGAANTNYETQARKTYVGCCTVGRRKPTKNSSNSADVFDCIQRHPPESSIWVKQVRRTWPQTVLTSDCEFEEESGSRIESVRLPIALELTLPRIQRQVQTVMAVCPFIFDPLEVIAELRATNYDTDACVGYLEKTKVLRDIIQEFLPTRTLRPPVSREIIEPMESAHRVFGMTEAELEAFLLHNKQRLQTIRRLQKDAVRRIQRLYTFGSGLVSVVQHILAERGGLRRLAENEDDVEKYKALVEQVSILSTENSQLKETLKKEEEKRKLLFNMMQEHLGNIRVFCRCRAIPHTVRAVEVTSHDTVSLTIGSVAEEYKFDRAFGTNATQAEIYTELVPLICSFMDGFNVSFITYGGESSGKTYTLLGGRDGVPETQGVVWRALRTVLSEKETRKNDWDINLKVGVVEVYNDTLIDLLGGVNGIHIRVDAGIDRMLEALRTAEIRTEDDIDELLRFCNAKRKVARTALNEASSRSHLIILVHMFAVSNIYQKSGSSVLAMCDLAGFEDIIKAETMGDQTLAKEAGFINRSLTALNRVFTSLKTQNPGAVSYRDSKLTYLLKPFFINSGKCILIVTVRTDRANLPSTQGTLRFGRDSRAVSLGRARRQISMEKLIQEVRAV